MTRLSMFLVSLALLGSGQASAQTSFCANTEPTCDKAPRSVSCNNWLLACGESQTLIQRIQSQVESISEVDTYYLGVAYSELFKSEHALTQRCEYRDLVQEHLQNFLVNVQGRMKREGNSTAKRLLPMISHATRLMEQMENERACPDPSVTRLAVKNQVERLVESSAKSILIAPQIEAVQDAKASALGKVNDIMTGMARGQSGIEMRKVEYRTAMNALTRAEARNTAMEARNVSATTMQAKLTGYDNSLKTIGQTIGLSFSQLDQFQPGIQVKMNQALGITTGFGTKANEVSTLMASVDLASVTGSALAATQRTNAVRLQDLKNAAKPLYCLRQNRPSDDILCVGAKNAP